MIYQVREEGLDESGGEKMLDKWLEVEFSIRGARWRKGFNKDKDGINQWCEEGTQKLTSGIIGELSKCGFPGAVEVEAWLEWFQVTVEDEEVEAENVDWWTFAIKDKQRGRESKMAA